MRRGHDAEHEELSVKAIKPARGGLMTAHTPRPWEEVIEELLLAAEAFMAAYHSNVIDIDIRIRLETAIAKARWA